MSLTGTEILVWEALGTGILMLIGTITSTSLRGAPTPSRTTALQTASSKTILDKNRLS